MGIWAAWAAGRGANPGGFVRVLDEWFAALTRKGVRFAAGCLARSRLRRATPCPVLCVDDVFWLLS